MDYSDLILAMTVVATAIISSSLVFILWPNLAPPRRISWQVNSKSPAEIAFLFEDDDLVDATPEARILLAQGPEHMADWPRLAAALRFSFPSLNERLAQLGDDLFVTLESSDQSMTLNAQWREGVTSVQISPVAQQEGEPSSQERVPSASALSAELAEAHEMLDDAPFPIWREDAAGAIRWANAAYIELLLDLDPEAETLTWPLPRLFSLGDEGGTEDAAATRRISLTVPDPNDEEASASLKFEYLPPESGRLGTHFALPADRLDRAEAQQREFLQTLAKTFAHLPTGLAVFDNERRLALFNPALTDLSKLQPQFLSRRPTLFEFLDELREARRMPEPKDYRDWRRRVGELETASTHGTHIETWSLPDGQVFRVTGRPHPNGAVAFLFRDITSEVSLTRRFRSELELGQAVVDSFPEAVGVFSVSGALVLSNGAYDALWEGEDRDSLAPANLEATIEMWARNCHPTPVWERLKEFVLDTGHKDPWTADLQRLDGRLMSCRVAPIAGNATLVGFTMRVDQKPRLALRPTAEDCEQRESLQRSSS